jgi:hypothetical protein
MDLMRLGLAVGLLLGCGCGGGGGGVAASPPKDASGAEAEADADADPVSGEGLEVSTEIRRALPKGTACETGDACGFFLQVISPGSDAPSLARRAVKILEGKCTGKVIVYRDPRNVMGAGAVLASAEEKRACEKALGRDVPDTDFPAALVFRVAR